MGVVLLLACVVLSVFLIKRPKKPKGSLYFNKGQISKRNEDKKIKKKSTDILTWVLILMLFVFGVYSYFRVFK